MLVNKLLRGKSVLLLPLLAISTPVLLLIQITKIWLFPGKVSPPIILDSGTMVKTIGACFWIDAAPFFVFEKWGVSLTLLF
ncbi:hypothetical protein J2Z65_006929 [Paenibacillus aceris]|uniref:Uncharacterized protein n=1 Tax=Paenibacillus aceris TaxID=869555 RepID=A0ABS4I9Q3_9BACL|nr:hypothetical protein [Paenibacillus aceris]